jgi:hypothetical protein
VARGRVELGEVAAAVLAIGLGLARFRGRRRGMFRALAGLMIGLIVVGLPARWLHSALGAADPRHHHRPGRPAGVRGDPAAAGRRA